MLENVRGFNLWIVKPADTVRFPPDGLAGEKMDVDFSG
jgi:hypothetical protein